MNVEFEGELVQETDEACLVDLGSHKDDEEGTWIPKSVMVDVERTMKTQPIMTKSGAKSNHTYKVDWIKFSLPENFAQKKGLI